MTTTMIDRTLARALLALVVLGLLAACTSTDIGNPDGDPDATDTMPPVDTTTAVIEFTAYEDGATPDGLTLASGLVVDELWLSIGSIDVLHGADCTERLAVPLEQPLVVDVISGLEHPVVPGFVGMPGDYCGLEMTLEQATADDLPLDSPLDLVGGTLLLVGVDASGLDFILRDVRDGLLALDAPTTGAFTLAEGRQHLFVAFALDDVIELDLLDGLLSDLLGPALILIDETTGDALPLLDGLRKSLFAQAALFLDVDDDGILTPAERTEPLATARP